MSVLSRIARALLTLILGVRLAGFGACGVMGTLGGLTGLRNGIDAVLPAIVFGLMGLGIAWVCWKAIASLWRRPPAE